MPKKNVKLTIKYKLDRGEMLFRWIYDKIIEQRKEQYGIDLDKSFDLPHSEELDSLIKE